jgi:hypothetical protein
LPWGIVDPNPKLGLVGFEEKIKKKTNRFEQRLGMT